MNVFENIPEKKNKNFKAIGAALGYSKSKIFFVS